MGIFMTTDLWHVFDVVQLCDLLSVSNSYSTLMFRMWSHLINASVSWATISDPYSRTCNGGGGEGHSAAGWGIGGSVYSCRLLGPEFVHSGNGLPLLALRQLVSLPVSTPLRIVNRCWSGFPGKWRYINVTTFNL